MSHKNKAEFLGTAFAIFAVLLAIFFVFAARKSLHLQHGNPMTTQAHAPELSHSFWWGGDEIKR